METKLYVVGKWMGDPHRWSFVGVFETIALAEAACADQNHFVGPCILNAEIVKDQIWQGVYYPVLEGKRG